MSIRFQEMIKVADEYYRTSQLCISDDNEYWIPCITSLALACEIYMKAIILLNGEIKLEKSHSLVKLFNSLPDQYKKTVKELLNINEEAFNNNLHNVDKSFVKWRYVYERGELSLKIGFLGPLCRILGEVCKDKIKMD